MLDVLLGFETESVASSNLFKVDYGFPALKTIYQLLNGALTEAKDVCIACLYLLFVASFG